MLRVGTENRFAKWKGRQAVLEDALLCLAVKWETQSNSIRTIRMEFQSLKACRGGFSFLKNTVNASWVREIGYSVRTAFRTRSSISSLVWSLVNPGDRAKILLAARWKPSGIPAAANEEAISSISPTHLQPLDAAL